IPQNTTRRPGPRTSGTALSAARRPTAAGKRRVRRSTTSRCQDRASAPLGGSSYGAASRCATTGGCLAGRSRSDRSLLPPVGPLLEQQPQPLAGQAHLFQLRPLDAKDLDRLVCRAVAPEITLFLAEGPQPPHVRISVGPYPDVAATRTGARLARSGAPLAGPE